MNISSNSQVDSASFPLEASTLNAATSPVTASSSVASLDSSVLQQTKSEIRSLAAEVARLAEADIPQDDFFSGFMPRVCSAMGSTGACAWQVAKGGTLNLLASHTAPAILFDGPAVNNSAPSDQHRRVLDCVIAEGQPILVPPGDVKIESDRPANPLSDALIVVPIRIEARVDYLLEVIQRPSGGPTAQRGYLRFVAQMADLMSDFLRRSRLREIDQQRDELHLLQNQLCKIAAAKTHRDRLQAAALASAELTGGDQAMLVSVDGRPRVVSTSHHQTFDPRSEPVLACQTLVSELLRTGNAFDRWLPATERRQAAQQDRSPLESNEDVPQSATVEQLPAGDGDNVSDVGSGAQFAIDKLCGQLGCRAVRCSVLNAASQLMVVVVGESATSADERKTLSAIGGLLTETQVRRAGTRWLRRVAGISTAKTRRHAVGVWVARTCVAVLATAVACFPVPQTVSAPATLHPTSQKAYYAPSAGTIAEVLVADGDLVHTGQPVVRIESPELQSQLEQLESQRQLASQQLEQKNNQRSAGRQLDAFENDQLESEIAQLETTLTSTEKQIEILNQQQDRLTILATQSGQISSWDVRNNLLHRPVQPGDLLVSTFAADTAWTVRIAVPERRIGQVLESKPPATATISLSSHADQSFPAAVRRVSSKAIQDESSGGGVVIVEASVDSADLPLKNDGAVARADIACGKVPLAWLVLRDAYVASKSRIQMLW
ncbi:MAG: HlyD family efflux transporter periplasmic adaptor subunit [Aureliella sp.]